MGRLYLSQAVLRAVVEWLDGIKLIVPELLITQPALWMEGLGVGKVFGEARRGVVGDVNVHAARNPVAADRPSRHRGDSRRAGRHWWVESHTF